MHEHALRNSKNNNRLQCATLRYADVCAYASVRTCKTLKVLQLRCRFLPRKQQSRCVSQRTAESVFSLCVCVCFGARMHACVRACVRATNPYLHLPSQFVPPPLCNGSVDQEQPGKREAGFCLIFKRRRVRFTGSPCFVLFFRLLESPCVFTAP